LRQKQKPYPIVLTLHLCVGFIQHNPKLFLRNQPGLDHLVRQRNIYAQQSNRQFAMYSNAVELELEPTKIASPPDGFPRFSELPAEIKERIYDTTSEMALFPPITLTNRANSSQTTPQISRTVLSVSTFIREVNG
jgi:hypothetical protein